MVTFELTEEQRLVQQTAREFAARELKPTARQRDQSGEFPRRELQIAADAGLLGVNVPGELGGAEAGAVAYGLTICELAQACPATTVAVAVTNMVAEVIAHFGDAEQRSRYVPQLVGGEAIAGAFALSEPQAGSDPAALQTRARRLSGGDWLIEGNKQWITSGDVAGVHVVWARTNDRRGARGISAFIVEGDNPGLIPGKHEDKMGLRGSSTVPLTLEECRVPAGALLGEEGGGFVVAMKALDGGRIGVAAQALGIGIAAQAEAVAYAAERQTFGKPLAAHQAIQWMIADNAVAIESARLLMLRAAWLKERGRPFTREASMAKLYCSEAANRICYRSLQIHGGYGYTKEYAVERLTRDARVTTIYEGTSEIQRMVIARHLLR